MPQPTSPPSTTASPSSPLTLHPDIHSSHQLLLCYTRRTPGSPAHALDLPAHLCSQSSVNGVNNLWVQLKFKWLDLEFS
ncbi:hypothetical protein L1887_23221 [Cichorium endivia]|nr:hypothetical protein L1887_23221 [Cichorium endivia]